MSQTELPKSELPKVSKDVKTSKISKNLLIWIIVLLILLITILISTIIFLSFQKGLIPNLQNNPQNSQNTSSYFTNSEQIKNSQNLNSNQNSNNSEQNSFSNSFSDKKDQLISSSNSNTNSIYSDSISNQKTQTPFQKYREKLEKIVENENPKVALTQLNADIYSTELAQKHCHSLTHAIGHKALAKYESIAESLKYNLDICGGGYVHGIIEEYLEQNPNTEDFATLCADQNDGNCLHSIGHGLMLINNYDVDKSVVGCDKLTTLFQKLNCGEGLFMENFDSENVSDANKPFLKNDNPFYPCSVQKDPFADSCYYYSGRYLFKLNPNPENALSKCLELDKFAATCVRGMAAGILRVDLFNPIKMEQYCQSIPKYKNSCLEGAVNYHLLMLDKPMDTQNEMCDKFQNSQNAKICTNLIAKSPFNTQINPK